MQGLQSRLHHAFRKSYYAQEISCSKSKHPIKRTSTKVLRNVPNTVLDCSRSLGEQEKDVLF